MLLRRRLAPTSLALGGEISGFALPPPRDKPRPTTERVGRTVYLPHASAGTIKVSIIEWCEDAVCGAMLGLGSHSVRPKGGYYGVTRVNVEGGS